MSARLFLCLILVCASFPLMARDARMMDANGAGGGSCQGHDDDVRRETPAVRPAARKPSAQAAKPAKPAATTHGGGADFDDVRPPRWHSFLPGMFR